MFVRKKLNESGLISVQFIDKSSGAYRVQKTIGASNDATEVGRLVKEGKRFIGLKAGAQQLDFTDYKTLYSEVLASNAQLYNKTTQLCSKTG